METFRGYPIDFVLLLIKKYVYLQKGILINPIVNLDNSKEEQLFLKASNIVITLHEEGKL